MPISVKTGIHGTRTTNQIANRILTSVLSGGGPRMELSNTVHDDSNIISGSQLIQFGYSVAYGVNGREAHVQPRLCGHPQKHDLLVSRAHGSQWPSRFESPLGFCNDRVCWAEVGEVRNRRSIRAHLLSDRTKAEGCHQLAGLWIPCQACQILPVNARKLRNLP